jgi:Protein of unknown function (DUF3574)
MRCAIVLALMFAAARPAAAVAQEPCPLPGQVRMLVVEMFFGRASPKGEVSDEAWLRFLKAEATPRFPDGLTAFDAYGQWRVPRTQKIVRERTKVLLIATADSAAERQKVDELAEAYRAAFSQKSVGIIASDECAAF